MRKSRMPAALVGSCLALGLCGAASAQSLPEVSGVVQFHGGASRFSADGFTDEAWREIEEKTETGVFAAVALGFSDTIFVQADLWSAEISGTHTDKYDGEFDSYSADASQKTSLAGHISWRPKDDLTIGVMASRYGIEERGSDPYYTVALEGARTGERWRLSTQAGMTYVNASSASIIDNEIVYGWAQYAYYPGPNLSIAGNLQAARDSFAILDDKRIIESFGVGARVEYKPDGLPVAGFVAYQARGRWESDDYWGAFRDGVTHAVTAGIRVPFGAGASSLQAIDAKVGLQDRNPVYGVSDRMR